MIERVARALAACEYDSGDFLDRLPEDDFEKRTRQRAGEDNCPSSVKVQFRSDARAVIEAMREPTEAMTRAGIEEADRIGLVSPVWEAMILAALKESAE